jgi:hypothetical protein
MKTPFHDLGDPIWVAFSQLNLDPSNPRVVRDTPPGYDHPERIFAENVQNDLTERVYEVYKAEDLEAAIVAQGWVPIDPIIVWEHPGRPGKYVTVEGNTRVAVLRKVREQRIDRETKKLESLTKKGKVPSDQIREQRQTVEKLEGVIEDTERVLVYPVLAASPAELEKKLPRLLGVRHITHAKQWTPYGANLYIASLYERLFHGKFGDEEELRLEATLISQVAAMVSLSETKTRRNIQAASAFGYFKREMEDRLPEGEVFADEDQYFFELILQNKYVCQQFGFSQDRLRLPRESEEALFEWAFKYPKTGKYKNDNRNIFYERENIRLWNTMATYDNKHGTSFAAQFDIDNPQDARPMEQVEAEFLQHKTRRTPVDTLTSLLQALHQLKAETLISQAGHLGPVLEEINHLTREYLGMINRVAA